MRMLRSGAAGAMGLILLFLGGSEAFLPLQIGRAKVNGQVCQSGSAAPSRVEGLEGTGVPRPSSMTLGSAVMDTPSDVADVEDTMPTDLSQQQVTDSRKRDLKDTKSQVKDELIELVSGGFLSTSARKRALVSELLLKLEALNPTEAPAYSPLLNGPWMFLYTGGISPGMLGLQLVAALSNAASGAIEIKDTTLVVSRAQPRVEVSTTVSVFGREATFKIKTNLEPETDLRLKETYVEATTGSLRLPLPRQGVFERSLFVSYLDEDLLVVRDSFGAPDILIRKDKSAWMSPFSGVPSSTDDDLAPGAG